MSEAYLKYYFRFKDGKILLDSMECLRSQEPSIPYDFLKWYEDGDFDSTPLIDTEEALKHTNELSSIIFAPRRVTFDVQKLLK